MSITGTLPARLRELRRGKRLTAVDAAAAIGISRSYLSCLETGKDVPGRQTLAALAQFYGTTMDDLEFGTAQTGDAPAYQAVKDATEIRLLHLWRLLNQQERAALLRVAESFAAPTIRAG